MPKKTPAKKFLKKPSKKLLTTVEAAARTQLNISTIQKWARTGKLRPVGRVYDKITGRFQNLYKREDIDLATSRAMLRLTGGDSIAVQLRLPRSVYKRIAPRSLSTCNFYL